MAVAELGPRDDKQCGDVIPKGVLVRLAMMILVGTVLIAGLATASAKTNTGGGGTGGFSFPSPNPVIA